MSYDIKPLSRENAELFTNYLQSLDFSHAPHWATCFCRYYHNNCSFEEWINRSGEQNRNEALDQIEKGLMKGYLAFDGEKCIGWCNANDIRQFIRLEQDVATYIQDKKVGCIICYLIHPDYRGKGVAKSLLQFAIDKFKEQEFDAVLALPIRTSDFTEKSYRGTIRMYEEKGFLELGKPEDASVMWLALN